jgi:hypothetical protein
MGAICNLLHIKGINIWMSEFSPDSRQSVENHKEIPKGVLFHLGRKVKEMHGLSLGLRPILVKSIKSFYSFFFSLIGWLLLFISVFLFEGSPLPEPTAYKLELGLNAHVPPLGQESGYRKLALVTVKKNNILKLKSVFNVPKFK